MKLLFIDHAYHKSTKSSNFIIDLLSVEFDIEIIHIDPSGEDSYQKISNIKENYDLVVIWQIDWLSLYFLSLGKKVVVFPMYDGSASLENIHWMVAKEALFINFSLRLHNKIIGCGGNSIYVKYFPPIKKSEKITASSRKPTAFFWERRPDSPLNSKNICNLLKNTISHLHIHQATDPGFISSDIPPNLPFTVSTSKWFENSGAYLEHVEKFDIYVAPRMREGIGMGFLEAMAAGKLVIAHDDGTHNEYIRNNYNGILFNALRGDTVNKDANDIYKIRKNSLRDSFIMRESWEKFYKKIIIKKIKKYFNESSCSRRDYSQIYLHEMLINLLFCHRDYDKYYAFLNKFYNNKDAKNISMKKVNLLELNQNIREAKEILQIMVDKYEGDSPHKLFLDLFIARNS